jgi:hypothetical protein
MKFKLKDATEIQISQQIEIYARALRVIGQDLSSLYPQKLEITHRVSEFEVSGVSIAHNTLDAPLEIERHLLGRLKQNLLRRCSPEQTSERPSDPISFRRIYTLADIDHLDQVGFNQRQERSSIPDIYSLPEMLRMVGRLIDAGGKRLHGITKDSYGVRFEYEDNAGKLQQEELSNLQLYKLQQEYYGERGTRVAVDTWKGSF